MGERLSIGEICTRSVTVAFRKTRLDGAARLRFTAREGVCHAQTDTVRHDRSGAGRDPR